MPTYRYRCEANQQIYEVRHSMNTTLTTWSELEHLTGAQDKSIPGDTPVNKVLTAVGLVKSSALKNPEAPPCANKNCCGGCSG
ncbi:zinc ribbon domain-containing protein [Gynuella sp.]|uniref:zinc ribbon domain-containing protein n=1 Tax=Gynuella sp. TaxID=2969146 RepID=UPI003D0AEC8F